MTGNATFDNEMEVAVDDSVTASCDNYTLYVLVDKETSMTYTDDHVAATCLTTGLYDETVVNYDCNPTCKIYLFGTYTVCSQYVYCMC